MAHPDGPSQGGARGFTLRDPATANCPLAEPQDAIATIATDASVQALRRYAVLIHIFCRPISAQAPSVSSAAPGVRR